MREHRLFLSPPHLSDLELSFVHQAFDSNYIAPLGPQVDAFEQEFSQFTGIGNCVALCSGTAAAHLAMKCLGVKPGDLVLASTLTFIGSVSPIIFQGGVPVFIDSDHSSWNMDPELLAEELERCSRVGKKPVAVVPTDLYGQCMDYTRIQKICDKYDVPVVADAAEAVGATYKDQNTDGRGQEPEGGSDWIHAGKGVKAVVFSFNGNKIITTAGGGMLASDEGELIEYARFLSQQARDPFPHYEHTEIGYNYRMSNILAAIGRGQLFSIKERVRRKREIFNLYQGALGDLPGIEFMPEASYSRSNRWLTVILITPEEFGIDREAVRLALEAENIESRPIWKPMHLQPVFSCSGLKPPGSKTQYAARVVGGRVAEDLFARGLCLPSGTAMSDSDVYRVADVIRSCRAKRQRTPRRTREDRGLIRRAEGK